MAFSAVCALGASHSHIQCPPLTTAQLNNVITQSCGLPVPVSSLPIIGRSVGPTVARISDDSSGATESSQAVPSQTRQDASRSSRATSAGQSGEGSQNNMGAVPSSNATELRAHTSTRRNNSSVLNSPIHNTDIHNSDLDSSMSDNEQMFESSSDDSPSTNGSNITTSFQKKKMRGGIVVASQNMRGGTGL
ncbi:hypothetical protein M422DRAFT_271592 [Sphaerobolus stellatus SS14]|uniref:Uncharacterized protein n=1 Tax=Sphaerobolus stellatus (strain SS14) TaxID=990650 RepID=A0A0C9UPA2_SPHS4|nr:hypothetical protein M422DRAFT_271592 [Sphaerobolus stellatus SS14]